MASRSPAVTAAHGARTDDSPAPGEDFPPAGIIGRVEIGLLVAGAIREREAVERGLSELLARAFESDTDQLNVVLVAESDRYVVFFARAVLGHTAGIDYSDQVRAALGRAGAAINAPSRPPGASAGCTTELPWHDLGGADAYATVALLKS